MQSFNPEICDIVAYGRGIVYDYVISSGFDRTERSPSKVNMEISEINYIFSPGMTQDDDHGEVPHLLLCASSVAESATSSAPRIATQ